MERTHVRATRDDGYPPSRTELRLEGLDRSLGLASVGKIAKVVEPLPDMIETAAPWSRKIPGRARAREFLDRGASSEL